MSKNKMTSFEKLEFFRNRQRRGDLTVLSDLTDYSISHISNVIAERRNLPKSLADAAYTLTSRRKLSYA